jgi:dihydrofolate reductase
MAKLIYGAITSLDGYINDEHGSFEWAMPSEEVHAFVNDLERGVGTYLYGRRLYDTMAVWETMPDDPESPAVRDYARIWRATDKVVYSTTLQRPETSGTRIERSFDPDAVRALVASADRDVSIGGAHLAGQALAAGLVDELYLVVVPAIVGGGTRALPADLRLDLELLGDRSFDNGAVYLRYRILK